jgi:DNA modification methylase
MKLINGDCLKEMKTLEDNSVDSIVTDPPYGLKFMGKKWDYDVPSKEIWIEALRVLKPGGHLLSFGGSRTYHRMAVAIEDAGFEIRDQIMWVMGSGFPKSLNIFKQYKKMCTCGNMEAYEKAKQSTKSHLRPLQHANLSQIINSQDKQGEILLNGLQEQSVSSKGVQLSSEVREGQSSVEGWSNSEKTEGKLQGSNLSEVSKEIPSNGEERRVHNATQISNGSTPKQIIDENRSSTPRGSQPQQQQDREPCAFCKQWGTQAIRTLGYGTALKPAHEPICLARKPLSEKNIANNVLEWGTGGINIDESRVGFDSEAENFGKEVRDYGDKAGGQWQKGKQERSVPPNTGRFPANFIHDGSDEVVRLFPNARSSGSASKTKKKYKAGETSIFHGQSSTSFSDSGSAARFFYTPKASKRERNAGLEGMEKKQTTGGGGLTANTKDDGTLETASAGGKYGSIKAYQQNNHPTVKPIALMEYLIRLITPPQGTVLDPFMGSGTTGIAAKNLGFNFIGIELDQEYFEIAKNRI